VIALPSHSQCMPVGFVLLLALPIVTSKRFMIDLPSPSEPRRSLPTENPMSKISSVATANRADKSTFRLETKHFISLFAIATVRRPCLWPLAIRNVQEDVCHPPSCRANQSKSDAPASSYETPFRNSILLANAQKKIMYPRNVHVLGP
jgi:hypothetical protein